LTYHKSRAEHETSARLVTLISASPGERKNTDAPVNTKC